MSSLSFLAQVNVLEIFQAEVCQSQISSRLLASPYFRLHSPPPPPPRHRSPSTHPPTHPLHPLLQVQLGWTRRWCWPRALCAGRGDASGEGEGHGGHDNQSRNTPCGRAPDRAPTAPPTAPPAPGEGALSPGSAPGSTPSPACLFPKLYHHLHHHHHSPPYITHIPPFRNQSTTLPPRVCIYNRCLSSERKALAGKIMPGPFQS